MDNFTFTNRETYLIWKKSWKHDYKVISELIRNTRNEIKNQLRVTSYADILKYRKLSTYKRDANVALLTLKLAKQAAQQQYTRIKAEAIAC